MGAEGFILANPCNARFLKSLTHSALSGPAPSSTPSSTSSSSLGSRSSFTSSWRRSPCTTGPGRSWQSSPRSLSGEILAGPGAGTSQARFSKSDNIFLQMASAWDGNSSVGDQFWNHRLHDNPWIELQPWCLERRRAERGLRQVQRHRCRLRTPLIHPASLPCLRCSCLDLSHIHWIWDNI